MLRIIVQWCQAPPSSKATAWDTVAQKSPQRNRQNIQHIPHIRRKLPAGKRTTHGNMVGATAGLLQQHRAFRRGSHDRAVTSVAASGQGAPGTVHADTGARASVPEWVLREAPRSGVKGCRAPRPERGGGRCSRAALRPRLEGNDGEAGEAGGSPAAVQGCHQPCSHAAQEEGGPGAPSQKTLPNQPHGPRSLFDGDLS